jgi:hypothetical protein
MSRSVSLSVNKAPVELDYFVQSFIDHTVGGMLEALEGTVEIKTLDIVLEEDKVSISLNGASVPLNRFVNAFVRNTVVGMVSSLKGVGEVDSLRLGIRR